MGAVIYLFDISVHIFYQLFYYCVIIIIIIVLPYY